LGWDGNFFLVARGVAIPVGVAQGPPSMRGPCPPSGAYLPPMKNLRSLFALFALFFGLFVSSTYADPVSLDQSYFYTDNPNEDLGNYYEYGGGRYGENYYFSLSYDFPTGVDLEGVEFNMWFIDSTDTYEDGDYPYGYAREGGMGLSWLDGSLEIPSELTGTITVGVTFYFTDGTVLYDYSTHEID
jgi:hypothetical protein